MNSGTYPLNLARGITDSACVQGSGVTKCAYAFDKKLREDGRRELSIQWLDDRGAETEIKTRMREGEPMFTRGFAVLKTTDLDEMCRIYEYRGLCYERSASKGNPYHGLIIMNEVDSKLHRREIMSELALRSVFYPYSQELPVG